MKPMLITGARKKFIASLTATLALSSAQTAYAQAPEEGADSSATESSTDAEAPEESSASQESEEPSSEAQQEQEPAGDDDAEEPAADETTADSETEPAPEVAAVAAPASATPAATEEPVDGYATSSATAAEKPVEKESPFILGVLWDMSMPVGSTNEFVGKYSLPGMSIDGRYRGFGNIGVGFNLAWHRMEEKTEEITTRGNVTVSGTQVREVSSSPFTAKVSYAQREGLPVVPYAALGVGGSRVLRRLDIGIARYVDESWHFALVPEIGLEIPAGPILALVSTRFNYLFKTSESPKQLYMNFSVGIGFD